MEEAIECVKRRIKELQDTIYQADYKMRDHLAEDEIRLRELDVVLERLEKLQGKFLGKSAV